MYGNVNIRVTQMFFFSKSLLSLRHEEIHDDWFCIQLWVAKDKATVVGGAVQGNAVNEI